MTDDRTDTNQTTPGQIRDTVLQQYSEGIRNFGRRKLIGADLCDAKLRNANLTNADLTDADLIDADLADADLTDANLTDADLTGANLTGAILTGVDLRGANLTGAILTCADLCDANLRNANLTNADLTDADLIDADLHGADLSNANLTGAILRSAKLRCANLTGAKLHHTNLTDADLTDALCDDPAALGARPATQRRYRVTATVHGCELQLADRYLPQLHNRRDNVSDARQLRLDSQTLEFWCPDSGGYIYELLPGGQRRQLGSTLFGSGACVECARASLPYTIRKLARAHCRRIDSERTRC